MRRGMASLTLYALLGLLLPFHSGGDSGWDVIWGASGGSPVGFTFSRGFTAAGGGPLAAADVGWAVDPQRLHDLHRRRASEGGDRWRRAAVRLGPCAKLRTLMEILLRYV